ncbi:MAG: transaldolase family protein [Bacteroidales bacterium]
MEFFLDSIKIDEVREASKLGFLDGLTTTPTFMHREGIKDVDAAILNLSKLVKVLMVEALGDTSEDIVKEAERLLGLGLDKDRVVFKIPMSLEGVKACKILVDKGLKVNLHLVYTLQQAYLAFAAGATYVCILVGRMQDQGQDALGLIEQCVKTIEKYNYKSKIMFSSVRNVEHVKDALRLGAHNITIPWSVMKQLPNNHFTEIGIQQFVQHTELLTIKASDLVVKDNVFLNYKSTILDGLMLMTKSKLGAIIVLDDKKNMFRIFTDGDLRRLLSDDKANMLQKKFSDIGPNSPKSVDLNTSLQEVIALFKASEVDNLVVTDGDKPEGLIDIQDVLKWI